MNYIKEIISQSFKKILVYRTTAVFVFLFGVIFSLIEIVATLVFYRYTEDIAGWTKYEFLLLVGTYELIKYLYWTFFVLSQSQLIYDIVDGKIDYFLIRPLDSQFICSFREIEVPSLINTMIPITIIIVSIKNLELDITVKSIILYIIFLVIGVIFYYLLVQIFITSSFWIEKAGGLFGIPELLFEIGMRPRDIYPRTISIIFSYFIPVIAAVNTPVGIIRGKIYTSSILVYILIIILLAIVTRVQWKKGLKRYTSAN